MARARSRAPSLAKEADACRAVEFRRCALQPPCNPAEAAFLRNGRVPSADRATYSPTHPPTHPLTNRALTHFWVTLCGSAYTPYLATPPYQVGHAVLCGARVDRQASGCGGRGRWAATAHVARAGQLAVVKEEGNASGRFAHGAESGYVTLDPYLGLPAAPPAANRECLRGSICAVVVFT